jgi:hypothetical protein
VQIALATALLSVSRPHPPGATTRALLIICAPVSFDETDVEHDQFGHEPECR